MKKQKIAKMFKRKRKNCKACEGSGYWVTHYGGDFDYYNKTRCGCSQRPTKKYKKALKLVEKGKKKSKILKKFYDNHSDCGSHKVNEYRSW